MHISLDLRSDIPIYIQIVEQVRQLVASGVLKPGAQLPTVRALASDLRVNFNTVARAYRLLDEAGIISTQQGRGTYILDGSATEIDEHIRLASLGALARRFLEESSRLGFTAQQAIKHLEDQVNTARPDS
jgi:GntR family transcriptional regulator